MDKIIYFFRDTLDGPLYIATVVLCVILLFACIGYLAERKLKDKKEKEKYATVDASSQKAATIEEVTGTQAAEVPLSTPVEQTPISNIPVPPQVSVVSPMSPPESIPSTNVLTEAQNTIVTPVAEVTPPVAVSPISEPISSNQVSTPVVTPPPSIPTIPVVEPTIEEVRDSAPVPPEIPSPIQPVSESIPEVNPITTDSAEGTTMVSTPEVSIPTPVIPQPTTQNETQVSIPVPPLSPSQPVPPSTNPVTIPVVEVPNVEPLKEQK